MEQLHLNKNDLGYKIENSCLTYPMLNFWGYTIAAILKF